MGLYDDLPSAKNDAAPAGARPAGASWARAGLAPPPRRAPAPAPRRAAAKPALAVAQAMPLPKPGRERVCDGAVAVGGARSTRRPFPSLYLSAPAPALAASAAAFAVDDEYDPTTPNEYEAVLRDRARAAADAAAAVDAARAAAAASVDAAVRAAAAAAADEAAAGARAAAASAAAAAAAAPTAPPSSPPVEKGLPLAARMMVKMGWKAGGGLGRQLQGMPTPLVARKTGRAAGVVAAADPAPLPKRPRAPAHPSLSRVVLLTNMVAPGSVDAALEDEVGAEASAHGRVARVVILELTDPATPPADAVRVFVSFADAPSAAAFAGAMAGRFFGGRRVAARAYDEGRFEAGDLEPHPGGD